MAKFELLQRWQSKSQKKKLSNIFCLELLAPLRIIGILIFFSNVTHRCYISVGD